MKTVGVRFDIKTMETIDKIATKNNLSRAHVVSESVRAALKGKLPQFTEYVPKNVRKYLEKKERLSKPKKEKKQVAITTQAAV